MIGAETLREGQGPRGDIDNGCLSSTGEARGEKCQQANRPRADNHNGFASEIAGALERMQAYGKRLRERCRLQRDMGGDLHALRQRDIEGSGEAPLHMRKFAG